MNKVLSQNELTSATWTLLKEELNRELEKLRNENEHVSKDVVATAVIRGQIKMIRSALALEESKPYIKSVRSR